MALGSTQPPVKMSTRNIPGGKGGRCVRLTSPPSRAECHEIWEPKPPGTLFVIPGLLRDCFTFLRGLNYGKLKFHPRRKLTCCCLCSVFFHMTGRQVLIYSCKRIPLYPVLAMKSILKIYLECKEVFSGGTTV
jgi:hypothetical protein